MNRSAISLCTAFVGVGAITLFLLAGCGALPPMSLPELRQPEQRAKAEAGLMLEQGRTDETRVNAAPSVPGTPLSELPKSATEAGDIRLDVEQIPLPDFVHYVMGDLLSINFQVDDKLAKRKELITLRSSEPVTRERLLAMLQSVLHAHGLALVQDGELYRVLPAKEATTAAPRILRSRSLPYTPVDLRPIFIYTELQSITPHALREMLKSITQRKVEVQVVAQYNAVILYGKKQDVELALEAIAVLDQPLLRGRQARRVDLAYMAAAELSKRLQTILTAEGYSVTPGGAVPGALVVVPVPESNSLILLAADKRLLAHAIKWIHSLDIPPKQSGGDGLYVYHVRHTDAESLVDVLKRLFSAPVTGGKKGAGAVSAERLIPNLATNSLIFRGSGKEFEELRQLMRQLDRPARQVLVEATIAELRINDKESTGIEWALGEIGLGDYDITGGTRGGLGLVEQGLSFTLLRRPGDIRALLSFLAVNNRARILSTPSVIARNGEEASISVGDDVPIITSQQTSAESDPDNILQTVEYRSTGVILNVKPVIHSGEQVDLVIEQEVSDAIATTTGVDNSPTISQRSIRTRLTAVDGATVVLGGLIKHLQGEVESGVPLLKDVPGLGELFRSRERKDEKTELLVLITPYILDEANEIGEVTRALRDNLQEKFQKSQITY